MNFVTASPPRLIAVIPKSAEPRPTAGRQMLCLLLGTFALGLGACGTPPPLRGDPDHSVTALFTAAPFGGGPAVYAIAVQPNGKFLAGGSFGKVDGIDRNGLVRFHADGSVESPATFSVGTGPDVGVNAVVLCLAVQADGKILVAGDFSVVAGQNVGNLARLNPDGSLDAGFLTRVTGGVLSLALQEDGKILLAGSFLNVNGVLRDGIARLHPDGSLDASFNPDLGAFDFGNRHTSVALQADGRILAGGIRRTGGVYRYGVTRFETDGTRDAAFNVVVNNGDVRGLVVQPDGKILINGTFGVVNGYPWAHFARLRADGGLDFFGPALGTGAPVEAIALQADGTIVLGGRFDFDGKGETSGIWGLLPDGTRSFTAKLGGDVISLALQRDGKMLVGSSAGFLDRCYNAPASETLTAAGPQARWVRTGAAPEIARAAFELSTDNGVSWAALGFGTRVADGWELNGLTLPASGHVRARGHTSGGTGNGSAGLVEEVVGLVFNPPETFITAGPIGTVRSITATFVFSASAAVNHFTYSLDGGAPVDTTASTVTFPGLSPGAHTFSVFATDLLGNADPTPATRAWTVNPSLPLAGSLDLGFAPAVSGSVVGPITVQPDGKILLAGIFTSVAGQPRSNLARLLPDGTLEGLPGFDPGTGLNQFESINAMAVLADGKILLGGSFSSINGVTRARLARLLGNGTLEPLGNFIANANGDVNAIILRPDGKILIAGAFTSVNGEARNRLALLDANGNLEPVSAFNPGAGPNGRVSSVTMQANGRILLAGGFGGFTAVDGQTRFGLARLNADGSLNSFNPIAESSTQVISLVAQADGKILVGGRFPAAETQPSRRIIRYHSDGTEDSAFQPGTGPSDYPFGLTLQADGKILVYGTFAQFNGVPRRGFARINANGSLEGTTGFDPGVINGSVYAVALQADGAILLGGDFTSVNGQARSRLARLLNDPASQSVVVSDPSRLQWLRSGATPEVTDVSFELSVNGGASWTPLGLAARSPGGWELNLQSLPVAGRFRARGRTLDRTGNPGLVEQTLIVLSALEQWRGQTFGANAGNPTISGNAADPDGDGAANLFEYAGSSDPLNGRSGPRFTWGRENGVPVLTYERRVGATGVVFGIERSNDLLTWTDAVFTEQIISANGATVTVKAIVTDNLSQPRAFLRAKLTPLP